MLQAVHLVTVITGTALIDSTPGLFGFYLATTLIVLVINGKYKISTDSGAGFTEGCYFGSCAGDSHSDSTGCSGHTGCSGDSGCSGCGGCGGGD